LASAAQEVAPHIRPADRIVVYLGPSLPLDYARDLIDARFLPPVQLGDIYQILATSVETIVIIDGLFDNTTPIWHREILAAIEAGIRVVGATSMGALRAAELYQYGMIGHGTIFEWFRDGVLDGDDEVALMHGNQELGYLKISEPMVNIRYNLDRAVAAGVISTAQSLSIKGHLKDLYFGDRKKALVPALIEDETTRIGLSDFFDSQYIDLKREDAISTLQAVASDSLNPAGTPLDGWYRRANRLKMPYFCDELSYGAVFHANGSVQPVADILHIIEHSTDKFESHKLAAVEYFWLEQASGTEDEISDQQVLNQWCSTNGVSNLKSWLLENGMQQLDWIRRVSQYQHIQSKLATLQFDPHVAEIDNWISTAEPRARAFLTGVSPNNRGEKILLIGRWALDQGYEPPQVWLDNAKEAQGPVATHPDLIRVLALYAWLIRDEPLYFGYRFSPSVAIFQQLQMQGQVAQFAGGSLP